MVSRISCAQALKPEVAIELDTAMHKLEKSVADAELVLKQSNDNLSLWAQGGLDVNQCLDAAESIPQSKCKVAVVERCTVLDASELLFSCRVIV